MEWVAVDTVPGEADQWLCDLCGLLNTGDRQTCAMCLSARDMSAPPPPVDAVGAPVDAGGLSSPSPAAVLAAPGNLSTAAAQLLGSTKAWVFDHEIPSVAGTRLTMVGAAATFAEQSLSGQAVAALCVPAAAHLTIEHSFGANGGPDCLYLNQYSLVMDVLLPPAACPGHFVSLLQTDVANEAFGDWYIDDTGRVG